MGKKWLPILLFERLSGKMIRHLERKHNISIKKNTENQEENDPIFLLLMFIITASLPFRCTDCWASVQNFSYIGVTAHFLDENFKLTITTDNVNSMIRMSELLNINRIPCIAHI
ncbi:zinc finger BED domain-containing 1-like [Brachionus plicatilis]|uniref:Zinc finger BED domain-containing 1-like n=1 Tax=Brachionus plicatilis TaxID=10195 RepID=A0A3M7R008_BRAPC|nr:zinc finger BED domain-containing 1-like [Brachionus plicatilis]